MKNLRLPGLLPRVEAFLDGPEGIRSGINKKEELKRLICEILIRETISLEDLLERSELKKIVQGPTEGSRRFEALKNSLTGLRYPEAVRSEEKFSLYLPRLSSPGRSPASLSHPFKPERIMIQKSCRDSALARRLQESWPDLPISDFNQLKEKTFDKARLTDDMGKRDLYVVEESFDIVKPCPCTTGAIPCGYVILNLGFGCPYDCTYCYLQHYANFPGILLPANLDAFFDKAEGLLKEKGKIRVGTGEYFDSLALDPFTGYATELLKFVKGKEILFEFKTKSANIGALLAVPAEKNVIIGWSLNPPELSRTEELYAATPGERLDAALQAVRHGYRVAFHFDPLILYPGWEEDYTELVSKAFQAVEGRADRIAWISLGCLRFYRGLKPITEQRFPEDPYLYEEFLLDPVDNKMRYPFPVRERIFRHILSAIRSFDDAVPVYLCMEDEKMWSKIFGHAPTYREIESSLTR